MFKEHHTETASWAYLVSQMVPGIELFGGIVLNRAVGGIIRWRWRLWLCRAVAGSCRVHADGRRGVPQQAGGPTKSRSRATEQLLPAVQEVLKVMAKHNLALSTGHVSPEEIVMLIRAAKAAGVTKSRCSTRTRGLVMSMTQMKEAVSLGALIEIVLSGDGGRVEDPTRSSMLRIQ